MGMTRSRLAAMIDHTLLTPEATPGDIAALIDEAERLGTWSVCVSPSMIPLDLPPALHLAVVCGFPSGAHRPEVKAAEAAQAERDGAEEVDMVINLANALTGRFDLTADEIGQVRRAAPGVVLKVILESAVLSDDQLVAACRAAEAAGADFVKTSTGFHPAGGASVHAVQVMAETVGTRLGVKASGGIRDTATALAMIDAGATRLGLSKSAAILSGLPE